ncbi:hypothetical protein C8A05DRAFT_30135 [Staphylotrichum tortipilum]|uniref:Pyridoxamine 5'-phosphate oxidase N-terminal domain-containing protein n=1 Tax=Staphylotrichum tortipilum TaxID=2831512 RepID=A0AAN6MRX7_9PEZI|nr:hypothetical protein C8A05DRAFT_30135 [Staphylotrichum longicolle]
MGLFFETIPEYLMEWILQQKMFWVATAPLSSSGHVNVSPKGGSYFGLLDDKTFWYMDLTGSGNETIAHLYEPGNGRITVMFCAFEGSPRIVRLFGHGTVLEQGTQPFDDFVKKHDVRLVASSRVIIIARLHQAATSCGYSVPFYEFKAFRKTLNEYFERMADKFEQGKSEDNIESYRAAKNSYSIDGLPGMRLAHEKGLQEHIAPIQKMVGAAAPPAYHNARRFSVWHLVLVALVSALCTGLSLSFLLTGSRQPLYAFSGIH